MWNKLFSRPKSEVSATAILPLLAPSWTADGVVYAGITPAVLRTLSGPSRQLAVYLLQLEEENCLIPMVESWLLPWEQVYALMANEEHQDSFSLLQMPDLIALTPVVNSSGGLSDEHFKVVIQGWRHADGSLVQGPLQREGAVCFIDGNAYLLPAACWKLLVAVCKLSHEQQQQPGENTNQLGWATIRKLARAANAALDGFLDRTIVLRPESLRLKLSKTMVYDQTVVEVEPCFDEQPEGWLASFDRMSNVPDHYALAGADGGITHVLIDPQVQAILQEVRAMPGRRVSGDKASAFLKNPYAWLGPEAATVLDPQEYEKSLVDAGIYFYEFAVSFDMRTSMLTDERQIALARLTLTAPAEEQETIEILFHDAAEFAPFVKELELKLAASMPCGFWMGYELNLATFDQQSMDDIALLLRRWQDETSDRDIGAGLDPNDYGERVIGIGPAEAVSSAFLVKESSEEWLPGHLLDTLGLDGELLSQWDTANLEHLETFKQNIEAAKKMGDTTVLLPGVNTLLSLATAARIANAWEEKCKPSEKKVRGAEPAQRVILQIENNIDDLDYAHSRVASINLASAASADLPYALLPETQLREHQLKGVAWLQHLFQLSPEHTSGCLLADDMGLGKTLQLLTFIAWHLERELATAPILIIAPVSLLDNWQREIDTFLHPDFAKVIKLYGSYLADVRMRKQHVASELREQGIQNLLKPDWRSGAQIVLTTYETLRDQQFSLAKQPWSIVICDEAQKIKNPAALVTQAVKALRARFRIACTGTPVENSLTDMWCLFDWIQPGLLGSLNEFGRTYRRPIEDTSEQNQSTLQTLRELIDPQILRRMKSDVARDLPRKLEHAPCKSLPMSPMQRRLYDSKIHGYQQQKSLLAKVGEQSAAMLGLLHVMKMVCAHPHAVRPEGELLDVSPKMRWLISQLQAIRLHGEKAIIFTELREIQRAVKLAILDHFDLDVTVINGDTSASNERGISRQGLIDEFQRLPGFAVIILSTTAVGFGVNVQKANHVIHFTRSWNPAKEDQATDRAYRIGQTKDVHVYYPTVTSNGLVTFEETLDKLLARKRSMAKDMLNGSGNIELHEFEANILEGKPA